MEETDVQAIVKQAIHELLQEQQTKSEPAYKTELVEERKRRETLERRVNELVDENKRTKQAAEQAERGAAIRAELQRLGVAKVDLAYRAVEDDIFRADDGRLMARGDAGEMPAKEYLTSFVSQNPEFLPARISGGSGITAAHKAPRDGGGVADLDSIRPGMSAEEMERVRKEILRVAAQNLKGL